jgi:hypothetical protein
MPKYESLGNIFQYHVPTFEDSEDRSFFEESYDWYDKYKDARDASGAPEWPTIDHILGLSHYYENTVLNIGPVHGVAWIPMLISKKTDGIPLAFYAFLVRLITLDNFDELRARTNELGKWVFEPKMQMIHPNYRNAGLFKTLAPIIGTHFFKHHPLFTSFTLGEGDDRLWRIDDSDNAPGLQGTWNHTMVSQHVKAPIIEGDPEGSQTPIDILVRDYPNYFFKHNSLKPTHHMLNSGRDYDSWIDSENGASILYINQKQWLPDQQLSIEGHTLKWVDLCNNLYQDSDGKYYLAGRGIDSSHEGTLQSFMKLWSTTDSAGLSWINANYR